MVTYFKPFLDTIIIFGNGMLISWIKLCVFTQDHSYKKCTCIYQKRGSNTATIVLLY